MQTCLFLVLFGYPNKQRYMPRATPSLKELLGCPAVVLFLAASCWTEANDQVNVSASGRISPQLTHSICLIGHVLGHVPSVYERP